MDVDGTYRDFEFEYHSGGDRKVTGTFGDTKMSLGEIEKADGGFVYHLFVGEVEHIFSVRFEKLDEGHLLNSIIEGSLGGIVANVVIGGIAKYFFLPHLPWGPCILFFIAIGAAGQVGDLYESELKRSSNIKDSGGLLPGHGGFLDRIDALLFAAPVAYVFKMYIL